MNLTKILRNIFDYLLILPLYFLPHHFLSRQVHRLVRLESVRFKHILISSFCKLYPIKLKEAEREDIREYHSFNDFFTRDLKSTVRPIGGMQLVSPVDGVVSEFGDVKVDLLYQAKNHYYTLSNLLGGYEHLVEFFTAGQFATLYLSPKDYHRIHMPIDGTLAETIYVPGRLFPVNTPSVRTVPNLFTRNERLVCVFDTEYGKIAMILVGALFVGSIECVWGGEITPPHGSEIIHTDYLVDEHIDVELTKGEEMGRFNLGSTVVLLLADDFARLDLGVGQILRFGDNISSI